ncbi:wiskott-Aldrich syndrome protein family member 2-like [Zingiber officinale]|uniref:wiskott-Aldrich syndrome protein family member 2-like n=1 Tax=Zingiber officinale TaxID=94328 RepID=UPI001C4CC5E8|nr:wiskott-Aldrich syndrome protein family member 2-like [Zingiber officinale]
MTVLFPIHADFLTSPEPPLTILLFPEPLPLATLVSLNPPPASLLRRATAAEPQPPAFPPHASNRDEPQPAVSSLPRTQAPTDLPLARSHRPQPLILFSSSGAPTDSDVDSRRATRRGFSLIRSTDKDGYEQYCSRLVPVLTYYT